MSVKGVFFEDAYVSNAFAASHRRRNPRIRPFGHNRSPPVSTATTFTVEQNLHGAADVPAKADECLADSPLVVDPLQPPGWGCLQGDVPGDVPETRDVSEHPYWDLMMYNDV